MDESGALFEGISSTARRKRSQTSRRPKPESQPLPEVRKKSILSQKLSDDKAKISSDENSGHGVSSKRKVFNLNQCASKGSSVSKDEREHARKKLKKDNGSSTMYKNGGLKVDTEQGGGLKVNNHHNGGVAPSRNSGSLGDAKESKLKKVKLKVGGVTRTIQTKPTSHATSGNGTSTKRAQTSDAPRPRPKLILQDDSDEDNSPPPDKKLGLQGIPWKDFSNEDDNHIKEDSQMSGRNGSRKQAEKSDRVRKSKRMPKKRDLNGEFDDDDDDEIRYLEKLRTSKVAAGYKDAGEESGVKQRSLSRDLKGGNVKDFGPSKSGKDGKKAKSERGSQDTDYEEEEVMSEAEAEGKKKKLAKDVIDSPAEGRKEIALTTRQRALLSGKDASSVSIEFPNGLPPPPPRKQKEKLTEVEQQLKKAEAAERRRLQNEKAARESEAEAIRKILGQDSSRKKREDKIKKRQEELAEERAANARTLPPNTIRCVMGPTGTTVTFSEDVGLPRIFDTKTCSYPPPREKCAGPSCNNPYKYRDSVTKAPLCSLQCYKAIHEKMDGGNGSCN
ncbi:HIT zinc finger, PAPA-1-like conserved region [Heracleum sosnowskyi]|uniref:HIT zinc finger, PAPA-1-like conserved region n=1 Tax=Heracleum sosnowskyi TaxID=360622 RepID=A0AAD8GSH2_9APIA|nr:HIT zinc finger, PAPA-1-like conserved region [Heracleum sosnowskyi]